MPSAHSSNERARYPWRKPQAGAGFPPSCCDQRRSVHRRRTSPAPQGGSSVPLENRQVVVVETAHQAWIERVRDAGLPQQRGTPSKCASEARPNRSISRGAASTSRLQALGSWYRGCAAGCCAGGACRRRPACLDASRNSDQRGAMRRALCGITERVEFERDILQPQIIPQPSTHHDVLGIDVRPGKTERFDPHLVKLTVAALLRPLVPEHRPAVVQAAAADQTAGCARVTARTQGGRALRPQRQIARR
jgi:hypothetical protein